MREASCVCLMIVSCRRGSRQESDLGLLRRLPLLFFPFHHLLVGREASYTLPTVVKPWQCTMSLSYVPESRIEKGSVYGFNDPD